MAFWILALLLALLVYRLLGHVAEQERPHVGIYICGICAILTMMCSLLGRR